MAVYRILVTKQVRSVRQHTWSTEYILVLDTPYHDDELARIRQTVAPLFAEFESHFYSTDVHLDYTYIFPLLASPNIHISSCYGLSRCGLRPFPLIESADPSIALQLTFQSLQRPWGSKAYRYAFPNTDVQSVDQHYQLQPESYQALQATLSSAKQTLQPLLQANPRIPSLALGIGNNRDRPQSYVKRYVRDIVLTGIRRIAYGSYDPNKLPVGQARRAAQPARAADAASGEQDRGDFES